MTRRPSDIRTKLGARSIVPAQLSAVLVLAATLACSSGDSTDASPATTEVREDADQAAATTTTLSAEEVEEEIIARYLAFWEARFAANSPPNPDHPDLPEYTTGELLERTIAEAQANLDAGVTYRQPDDPIDFRRVEVLEVDGDRAIVQDCRVDDGLVVRRSDGAVLNDAVATQNLTGELQRVDGEWRVATSTLVQRWEGVAGCALTS